MIHSCAAALIISVCAYTNCPLGVSDQRAVRLPYPRLPHVSSALISGRQQPHRSYKGFSTAMQYTEQNPAGRRFGEFPAAALHVQMRNCR